MRRSSGYDRRSRKFGLPNEKAAVPLIATLGERPVPAATGSPATGAWLLWNSKSRPHWNLISLVNLGPSTELNRPITQSSLTPSSPQLSTPFATVAAVCTPAGDFHRRWL